MDFRVFIDIERMFSDLVEHMALESRPDVRRLVDRLRELIGDKDGTFFVDHRRHEASLEAFAAYLENVGRGVPGHGAIYAETCRAVRKRNMQCECLRLSRRIRSELECG